MKKTKREQKHNTLLIPSTWAIARAVGWVTFLEVIRDKVLYNVILCAFFLFFLGFFASKLNFLNPERIIQDFGLLAINLSCSFLSILIGSGLLPKEFERRTIYVALSRPISKPQFVLGKFLGISWVVALNWALQVCSYLLLLSLSSESPFMAYSWTLGIALAFLLIQSLILSSIAILFSTFTTTSLSVMMSLGLYLIGNNISQMRLLATRLQASAGSFALNSIALFLPNLEHFNLGLKVTYGLPVSWKFVVVGIFYGFFVVAVFLFLASLFIRAREV